MDLSKLNGLIPASIISQLPAVVDKFGANTALRLSHFLAQLAHEIPAVVAHALHVEDTDRQAFAPMLAILSAQHETQYSRLFRS